SGGWPGADQAYSATAPGTGIRSGRRLAVAGFRGIPLYDGKHIGRGRRTFAVVTLKRKGKGMDFKLSARCDDLRQRLKGFVDEILIPLEDDAASFDEHENIDAALLKRVQSQARAQGLWSLQMPRERGGQGLSMVEMAACYEEMNRSIF